MIVAVVQSETLRDVAQRAVNDGAALVRDLRNPANARDFVRSAARHPAARELASVGLMFLPGRYLPLGWAATWAAHKVLRRYIDPPTELLDTSGFRAADPYRPQHDDLIVERATGGFGAVGARMHPVLSAAIAGSEREHHRWSEAPVT